MKVLGFILVTISSAICGLCYCAQKSERLDDLNSFCLMFELMQGEITNRLSPIPELSHSISSRASGKARSFLNTLSLNLSLLGEKNFETIWCESYKACGTQLNSSETESVLALGKIIGRYDAQTQCEGIHNTIALLRSSLEKERSELPQIKKLSVSVSMSLGAFLAILLV